MDFWELVVSHATEEYGVVTGAPIAVLALVVALALGLWFLFRYQLTNRATHIAAVEARLVQRDEEIVFLRRGRDPDIIQWFKREAQHEITKIRNDPGDPFFHARPEEPHKKAMERIGCLYRILNIDNDGPVDPQKPA